MVRVWREMAWGPPGEVVKKMAGVGSWREDSVGLKRWEWCCRTETR